MSEIWARSSWGSGGHGVRGVRTVATYVNGPRDIWGNFNTMAVVALRFFNTAKGIERDTVVFNVDSSTQVPWRLESLC